MKKEDMRCENCIFFFKGLFDNTCRVNSQSIIDLDDTEDPHYVDFPSILHPTQYWCGQGEWFSESRNYPGVKMIFRWGEWNN